MYLQRCKQSRRYFDVTASSYLYLPHRAAASFQLNRPSRHIFSRHNWWRKNRAQNYCADSTEHRFGGIKIDSSNIATFRTPKPLRSAHWASRSISPSICLCDRQLKIAKRFRLFGDENGAIDGALCRRREDHRRELPMHRCAGLASARLSSIAAAVLMGLEAGWRACGLDQCRDGTASRNLEIPKSPVR